MRSDSFFLRLAAITAAALLLITIWQSLPLIEAELLGRNAEPRAITARGDLAADEETTIALFEAAKESVVFITTEQRVRDPWTRNAYDVPRGSGSGFLWDRQGHVVTNDHVLAGASGATVRLADGRSFPAQLVGRAPENDLAVLRIGIPTRTPEPVTVGESRPLKVGQKVFAIGNPFGLDFTLTTGIVSALDREIPSERGPAIRGLIQTDAAINPGNSGGPLLDSAGRLIGVNTAIFSPSGASAGIGFAVPVDTVNRVVPQLIATGRYSPPQIGVVTDPTVDAMARRAGLSGTLILEVVPGSPAAQAALTPARQAPDGRIIPGDRIVAVDGAPVADAEDLRNALARHSVGDQITLDVANGRGTREITLTLVPA